MIGELLNVASVLAISTTPPIVLLNVVGDGLRVEWSVEKTRTRSPDRATITIYNLGRVFREALNVAAALPLPLMVNLGIGWGGIPEQVFFGQVWKVSPEMRTATDVLTTIEAGDGDRDIPPPGGALAKAPAQLMVAMLLLQMRLVPSPAALAEIATAAALIPIQVWQHVPLDDPRDELDWIMGSIGLSWGQAGGRFVVYRNGVRSDVLPTKPLMPKTGLLRWSRLDDGGVEFEALAQPALEPGGVVAILDAYQVPIVSGVTSVESVSFSGSSEGPSIMKGIARKVQLF